MRRQGRLLRASSDALTSTSRIRTLLGRSRAWTGHAIFVIVSRGAIIAALTTLAFGVLLNHRSPLFFGEATDVAGGETTGTVEEVQAAMPELLSAPSIVASDELSGGFAMPPGQVALTFDDGPDPIWTPLVLDELDRLGVTATFFVIGERVDKYPELVREIVRRGHEVGNHTQLHYRMGRLDERAIRTQLDLARLALIDATGLTTDLYRPPYSSAIRHLDANEAAAAQIALDEGYVVVATDRAPHDYDENLTIDQLLTAGMPTVGSGAVITLHDGGGDDRSRTVELLDPLVSSLRTEGFSIVALGDVVEATTGVDPIVSASRWDQSRAVSVGWVQRMASYVETVAIWGSLVFAILFVERLIFLGVVAVANRLRRNLARSKGGLAPDQPFGTAPVQMPVTVIVPAYNEAVGIEAAIRSIDATEWPELEILVVDDGSTDDTSERAEALGLERVRVIRKTNGGKASALNLGIRSARHDIIVMVDGDTILEPETIPRLVAEFRDPNIGAVAGNPKIGNRQLLARLQVSEYLISSSLERRILAPAQMITTIPGAVGAWRRAALQEVGGVSTGTLAEDTDLTVAIARGGFRIAYAPNARAWTEAPSTVKGLYKQRVRWTFGTLQVLWKHHRAVRDFGAGSQLGRGALPYIFVTGYVFAALAPIIDIVLLANVFLGQWEVAVISWGALAVAGMGAGLIAARLDGDRLAPALLVPLQQILFRPLLHLVALVSLKRALLGERQVWGTQQRVGGLAMQVVAKP